MAFSPKRAKAVAQGRVMYRIYDGDKCVYESKHFFCALQMADQLQKANPNISYEMKLEEIKHG